RFPGRALAAPQDQQPDRVGLLLSAAADPGDQGSRLQGGAAGDGVQAAGGRELLRLCFDELDLRRVVARCFSDNEASWRLMERLRLRARAPAAQGAPDPPAGRVA